MLYCEFSQRLHSLVLQLANTTRDKAEAMRERQDVEI